MKIAHPPKNDKVKVNCKDCSDVFVDDMALKKHRLSQHRSYKPCNKIQSEDPEVRCKFREACYYSHVPVGDGKYRCFKCGEEFSDMQELMKHRKWVHNEMCRQTAKNSCRYSANTCWFNHNIDDRSDLVLQNVQEIVPWKNFWVASQEPAPHIEPKLNNQTIPQIMQMFADMTTTLQKIMNFQQMNNKPSQQ